MRAVEVSLSARHIKAAEVWVQSHESCPPGLAALRLEALTIRGDVSEVRSLLLHALSALDDAAVAFAEAEGSSVIVHRSRTEEKTEVPA